MASFLADRRFLVGVAAGVGAAGLLTLCSRLTGAASATSPKTAAAADAGTSTTSSAHGNAVYETAKAVAEYLQVCAIRAMREEVYLSHPCPSPHPPHLPWRCQFHYAESDLLPYEVGPHEALNFASR